MKQQTTTFHATVLAVLIGTAGIAMAQTTSCPPRPTHRSAARPAP
jgi:hypothetical protein